MKKHYLILGLILFVIFIFHFPSLFEPFWYGDEGIFAAVANNLNQGGVLYQTAWDNKPPMIYLTYAAIFKSFGVSMFWLRLSTSTVVLTTAVVIYEIAKRVLSEKRALWATLIFGFLTSLRLIEGNLALTEIFMILPISLAMLIAIKRNFDLVSVFGAGLLLSIASLFKQVGTLEAVALGLFLFLISRNFEEFFKKGLVLTGGFLIPYGVFILYFATQGLLGDFIFAAYTYYRIYLAESPRYAILIDALKLLPILAAFFWGFYQKSKRRLSTFHLWLLWAAFAFWGSFFSGRTYGHYLVQAVPAVALLAATISVSGLIKKWQGFMVMIIFFVIPILLLLKILFANFVNVDATGQIDWWRNFSEFAAGRKTLNAYNDYFDKNVNRIMALSDFLRSRADLGTTAYIWGDYPWLYAIADLKSPVRYVTSFHVFGVPSGSQEVAKALDAKAPKYIIKPPTAIGYFAQLEKMLVRDYASLAKIEDSEVFVLRSR